MKTYIEKVIPARTEKVLQSTICDLCKEEIPRRRTGHFDEVEVTRRVGDSWGDCGSHEVQTIDMCPKCWHTKFVPWLESQGTEVSCSEVDW